MTLLYLLYYRLLHSELLLSSPPLHPSSFLTLVLTTATSPTISSLLPGKATPIFRSTALNVQLYSLPFLSVPSRFPIIILSPTIGHLLPLPSPPTRCYHLCSSLLLPSVHLFFSPSSLCILSFIVFPLLFVTLPTSPPFRYSPISKRL